MARDQAGGTGRYAGHQAIFLRCLSGGSLALTPADANTSLDSWLMEKQSSLSHRFHLIMTEFANSIDLNSTFAVSHAPRGTHPE